jgi:hypothetical protein
VEWPQLGLSERRAPEGPALSRPPPFPRGNPGSENGLCPFRSLRRQQNAGPDALHPMADSTPSSEPLPSAIGQPFEAASRRGASRVVPKSSPSASRTRRCASRSRGPSRRLRNWMRASRLEPPARRQSAASVALRRLTRPGRERWLRVRWCDRSWLPLLSNKLGSSPLFPLCSTHRAPDCHRWTRASGSFRLPTYMLVQSAAAGPEKPSAARRTANGRAASPPAAWPTAEGPSRRLMAP